MIVTENVGRCVKKGLYFVYFILYMYYVGNKFTTSLGL